MEHLNIIIELLLLCCLVAMAMRYIKQPYTIALVLMGLALALTKLAPPLTLTHDVAFYIILPPILFQGGMHMQLDHLKKDLLLISLLAIPGVAICAFLVGYPLATFWHIPLDYALLFGALIAATDPVSVLALLKKVNAPDRLRTILEAESLFNDGTGVVLFMVFLDMIQNHEPFCFTHVFFQFLIVTGGGVLVGGLCGFLVYRILQSTEDHLLQVTLTIVLTFSTPVIAES